MNYRYDIELLKGCCILFITLYHNNIYLFHNGYLGVIVFINVSGYLSSRNDNKIIFKSIYTRFVRISPSYYILIITTSFYIVYQNSINNSDVEDLYYVFGYVYNFRLIYRENDYFLKENLSAFTHLWYISVIFQLYIILIFTLCFTDYNIYICYAISLTSFLYNFINEFYIKDNIYYYNTFLRIWYYFLPLCMKFYINVNIYLLIFIITLLCIYKVSNIFTNIVLLSFISNIICNISNNPITNNMFSNSILFLGRISYSLYLYHYMFINNHLTIIYKLLISVSVASLNHFLIEMNIKKYGNLISLLIVVGVLIMNSAIHVSLEKKKTDNNIIIIKSSIRESHLFWCSHCHLDEIYSPTKYNILLVGDSHLEQWIPAMLHFTKSHGIMLHYFYFHLKSDNYTFLYTKYFETKNISFVLVILGFVMSHFPINKNEKIRTKLINMINFFNIFIPKVLYIEDSPILYRNNICLRCYERKEKNCYTIVGKNATLYPRIIPFMNNTIYLSLNDRICKKKICPCIVDKISVYDTMSHLSPLYTKKYYNVFSNILSKELKIENNLRYNAKMCNFYVHGKYYYRRC